jgi:hypothetical protein
VPCADSHWLHLVDFLPHAERLGSEIPLEAGSVPGPGEQSVHRHSVGGSELFPVELELGGLGGAGQGYCCGGSCLSVVLGIGGVVLIQTLPVLVAPSFQAQPVDTKWQCSCFFQSSLLPKFLKSQN